MLFTKGITECAPSEVAYDESRIEVLNNHFQRCIDSGEIVCATYCAARKGKVFMHGAVGKHSYKNTDERPVQPDAIQYIASVTKTFTAVAIMQLVENGITRLDVPVGSILPQFDTPPFNKINLFHLLTHTSGLQADHGCFENKYRLSPWGLMRDGYKLHKPEDGEFDWIAASLSEGIRMEPDKEWAYCSFGFVVLGAVIEKLTGIRAELYIEDNIIKPLGMKDTSFEVPKEKADRIIIQNEGSEEWIKEIKSGSQSDEMEKNLWSKVPRTGGGLNSTVFDMVRYGNAILNHGTFNGVRIIGRKALEKMTRFAIHNMPNYTWNSNEKDRGFGIGFDMRNGPAFTFSDNTFMHEGAGSCTLYMDPAEDLVAAWIIPFAKEGWFANPVFNTQNVIWSGLI